MTPKTILYTLRDLIMMLFLQKTGDCQCFSAYFSSVYSGEFIELDIENLALMLFICSLILFLMFIMYFIDQQRRVEFGCLAHIFFLFSNIFYFKLGLFYIF